MHGTIHEFEQLPLLVRRPAVSRVRVRRARTHVPGAAPLVGIIRNPRSHRNRGQEPELDHQSNILTAMPRSRAALQEVLANFADRGIQYLAVDGGDGTVRDVLTCGAGIFGDHWPKLIVLPKGKTNALAVDLGLPNVWSLSEALRAAESGRTVERRPLTVDDAGGELRQVHGFILGAGVFTLATQAGQQAHRWGAFNSFAVALIILWGLLQSMFGNARHGWRAGTRMILRRGLGGPELPHSGPAGSNRRFLLLASTLQRFPLSIKPFGVPRPGLKLALIDTPRRRILAALPLLITIWPSRLLKGMHRIDSDAVEVELGDRFILDGEYFPAGRYLLRQGPRLRFVVP